MPKVKEFSVKILWKEVKNDEEFMKLFRNYP